MRSAQTRSRENSRAEAMAALQEAVSQRSKGDALRAENVVRSAHVGSGERGDKRRTYRWQEGLVHDHVTGRSASLDRVLKGDFTALWR